MTKPQNIRLKGEDFPQTLDENRKQRMIRLFWILQKLDTLQRAFYLNWPWNDYARTKLQQASKNSWIWLMGEQTQMTNAYPYGSDLISLKVPFLIIMYPGSRGRFSKYSQSCTNVSVKIKLWKALATNYNWLLLSPAKKKKTNVKVRQDHFWPRLNNIDRDEVRWGVIVIPNPRDRYSVGKRVQNS